MVWERHVAPGESATRNVSSLATAQIGIAKNQGSSENKK